MMMMMKMRVTYKKYETEETLENTFCGLTY